eukprot:4305264-Amphidinium_carterae.1
MSTTQDNSTQLALSFTNRVPSCRRRTTHSRSTIGQAHVLPPACPMFRSTTGSSSSLVAAGHHLLGPVAEGLACTTTTSSRTSTTS